jgi:hypothetical protein
LTAFDVIQPGIVKNINMRPIALMEMVLLPPLSSLLHRGYSFLRTEQLFFSRKILVST